MKSNKLRLFTLTSMFTALTAVATMIIRIPTFTRGYINLGDTIVNISAWLLGGLYGGFAGGVGSALADILSGCVVYAPATLIIKFLMAFACFRVYAVLSKKINNTASRIISVIVSELIMTAGYAVFTGILYKSLHTALLSIPENLIQGVIGAGVSVALYECIVKRIPSAESK